MRVISYGGGVQSTALLVLAAALRWARWLSCETRIVAHGGKK